MNRKHRRIIAGAVIVFILATFVPPWVYTHDRNGSNGGRARTPAGYYCILSPPSPKSASVDDGVSLDMSRLVLEWVCILVTAGAVRFFLNVETGTPSAAKPTAPLPRSVGNRKSFSREMKWIALGVVAALIAFALPITIAAIRQSKWLEPEKLAQSKTFIVVDEAKKNIFDEIPTVPDIGAARSNADKGHADAQYALGSCYFNADGVAKDYVMAAWWYRKAADQGYAPAQNDLGLCYENGFGVPRDTVRAYVWYNLAAAQRQKAAIQNLALLEKKMTPEKVVEAQQLSRESKVQDAPTGKKTRRMTAEEFLDSP
jgi:hypothetical protein